MTFRLQKQIYKGSVHIVSNCLPAKKGKSSIPYLAARCFTVKKM